MNVGRHILIYLASSVIGGLVPLLLLPILTRELQPAEYGTMVTMTTLVALTIPVVNWGVIPYLGVQFFNLSLSNFKQLFSTIWIIPVVSTSILVCAAMLASPWTSVWINLPRTWFLVVPLLAATFFFPLVAQNLLRMRRQPYSFAAVELSNAAINFGLTLILILAVGIGWQSRILAVLGANIAISVAALAWLGRQGFFAAKVSPALLRPALSFGAGVTLHDLANNTMRLLDRLLVAVILGPVALGQYGVAAQIASVMLFMLGALNKAWTPFVFASLSEDTDTARVELVRRTYQAFVGLIIFFCVFNVGVPFLYKWLVDARYQDSSDIVFWLSLGYLFNGFYLTVVDRIFYLKKTHLMAIITVSNALVYAGLSYFLLQALGPIGVAIAFAITSCIVMCATFVFTQWLSPLPWLRALKK